MWSYTNKLSMLKIFRASEESNGQTMFVKANSLKMTENFIMSTHLWHSAFKEDLQQSHETSNSNGPRTQGHPVQILSESKFWQIIRKYVQMSHQNLDPQLNSDFGAIVRSTCRMMRTDSTVVELTWTWRTLSMRHHDTGQNCWVSLNMLETLTVTDLARSGLDIVPLQKEI